MDLAALYRRVSTDHQDGSLELQERRVHDYCAFKGLATAPELTFEDPDTSGRTPLAERPGGHTLLARLRLGDVRHLAIAKLDRLGRNTRDVLATLKFLSDQNVTLHITDLGGESITTQGHIGKLILGILALIAEWEVEEIRDRTRKQMRALFDTGQLTGNVPFGFDCRYTFADGFTQTVPQALPPTHVAHIATTHGPLQSKLLVDNEPEQHILRHLAALRAAGLALNKVAAAANGHGYVTKLGRPWSTGAVDSVLYSRHTALVLQTSAPQAQAA